MPKRFTDTAKWADPWFRKLRPSEKLLWFYLCDNCDYAGILEWDAEAAAFHTGLSSKDIEGAYKGLARGFLTSGRYLMVRNFLKHQKNHPLNEVNNAHRPIIKRLADIQDVFPEAVATLLGGSLIPDTEAPCKGLGSPLGKGKGNGTGRGNGKEGGGEGDGGVAAAMLAVWTEVFPEKRQPRASLVLAQIQTRLKTAEFADNWEAAIRIAGESPTLRAASWFNFRFVIKNADNYQKVLDRWMQWKDDQLVESGQAEQGGYGEQSIIPSRKDANNG